MKLTKLNTTFLAAGLFMLSGAAMAQSQWSMTGSSSGNANASVGTVAGDAAYARAMRAEYAKDALQNSTTNTELAMSQSALQSNDCNEIVKSADTAKKEYVVRHTAPDPTQVIKNSTCFIDVFSIKIPMKTGFGWVDGLVGELSKFAGNAMCNKTNDYWSKIQTASKSGDLKSLSSSAISSGGAYIAQQINTPSAQPMQSTPYSSGSGGSSGYVTQPGGPVSYPQPGVGQVGTYPQPGVAVQPGQPYVAPKKAALEEESGVANVMKSIGNWLR